MARKTKNKRNRYRSIYQLGGLQGVPTNLNVSDTTNVTPIQRGQQLGLLSNSQNIMQQQMARLNAREIEKQNKIAKNRDSYIRPGDLRSFNQFKKTIKPVSTDPMQAGPRLFQGGGMYADNTVQAAAQGLQGSTSNIVYQEQDPKLQQQRLLSQEEELNRLQEESKVTEQEVKQQEEQGKLDVQAAALKQQQKFAQGEMAAGALSKAAGMSSGQQLKGAALSGAIKAYQGVRAANLGSKLTQAGIAGAEGAKVASLAGKAGAFPMSSATTGKTIITGAGGNVIKGGSAVGAGLKSFMSSGAGLGTVASLAGAGLKKWAADDDPTTADWGDVGGSALSAAGTGMAIGSVIPGIGTAVGGIVGGLYGAGKSIFTAKKAKKEQDKYLAKIEEKKRKYSKEVGERFATQGSAVRAGELKGKTYSGYDYGRNIMAQLGGMRMGIPRYGYAA